MDSSYMKTVSKELLDKLETVQRQALLYATCAYKKTSHKQLLLEVGLPLLEKRRHSQKIQFIYKANRRLLPDYLKNKIPPKMGDLNEYNTRFKDNIQVPLSHKNYMLKSYIPSSIKAWNDTTIDIKRALSLQSLKAKLSDLYGSTSYHLYLSEDGNGAVNHSRMRMGLSALNAHRRKYNFIERGNCEMCNHCSETTDHFFLTCPAYAAQRQQMFGGLGRDTPQAAQEYLDFQQNKKHAKPLVHLLLHGTGSTGTDANIFKHVQQYIADTKRFK